MRANMIKSDGFEVSYLFNSNNGVCGFVSCLVHSCKLQNKWYNIICELQDTLILIKLTINMQLQEAGCSILTYSTEQQLRNIQVMSYKLPVLHPESPAFHSASI